MKQAMPQRLSREPVDRLGCVSYAAAVFHLTAAEDIGIIENGEAAIFGIADIGSISEPMTLLPKQKPAIRA